MLVWSSMAFILSGWAARPCLSLLMVLDLVKLYCKIPLWEAMIAMVPIEGSDAPIQIRWS